MGEWLQQLAEAGLRSDGHVLQRLRLEFGSWVERMRTPGALRQLQAAVGAEVREYFEIEEDGSFSTDVIVLWGRR